MRWRRAGLFAIGTLVLGCAVLTGATWRALMPLPASLGMERGATHAQHFVAVDGTRLNDRRSGRFNRADALSPPQIPRLLRAAFIASEDHRYWHHGGVDWRARFAALWANLRAGHVTRGASTIGEQAARILAPRPRSYWSHWVAGFDADRLLRRFGHAEVLTFYLNQVPYAGQRRGVAEAARYYFGRDVGTLDPAEQLALAVLVRSPRAYDPRRHPAVLRRAVDALAARMRSEHAIDATEADAIRRAPIQPGSMTLAIDAGPFVVSAAHRARALGLVGPVVSTTLDPSLEAFVQKVLRERVARLAARSVCNAAALVVDNVSGAVLAWAVAPRGGAYAIDPVLAPRQPGSTLKPFVYGLAMARLGWQPDHVLEDTPLSERIASGVHRYRNYSGRHYGRVSLRYALANSLNVPAVRTAQAVGVPTIIATLQQFGFTTFDRPADYYGPAIVLGDGAVSLYDLVQGYSGLARHGRFLPLHVLEGVPQPDPVTVVPAPVAALLANILSDPDARSAEFGAASVLDLPFPTAVKTGTSSDYHDLWTVGFDDRYTVGVWMGRLDGGATDGLTGSAGPAPVLRQIFNRLRAGAPYAGLWHSPALHAVEACEWIGPPPCVQRSEWYVTGTPPPADTVSRATAPVITQPLEGEMLAIDPRVPRAAQRFRFTLAPAQSAVRRVVWQVDGKPIRGAAGDSASWLLEPGAHRVSARVWLESDGTPVEIGPVAFSVAGASPAS